MPTMHGFYPTADDYVAHLRIVESGDAEAVKASTARAQKRYMASAMAKMPISQEQMKQSQVLAGVGPAAAAAPRLDLQAAFRDIARPRELASGAAQALANELYRGGRRDLVAFYGSTGAKVGDRPHMTEFNACSWAVMELAERFATLDPAQAEQAFRQLWWRGLRALEQAPGQRMFVGGLAGMALGYYQQTQQAARLVPFYKAQERLGEAMEAATQRFKANAGLASYAYTIGQTEAFEHYARLALGFAAEACRGKGTPMGFLALTPRMRKNLSPALLAQFEGAMKGITDVSLFPDLGILARQLEDQRRSELLQRFVSVAGDSEALSGRLCGQVALVMARAGRPRLARVLADKASGAYRAQIKSVQTGGPAQSTMRFHREYLQRRAPAEAKLVRLLLAHHRGERPRPWAELAKISAELWGCELLSQKSTERFLESSQRREQALVAGWAVRQVAYDLPLTQERVRSQALAFLMDGFFEVSPLIETLEESDTNLAIALYLVGVSSQEGKREGISIQDRAKLFDAVKNRTLYRGLLRSLARRGKAGDADRAWAISELSRARQLKELLASDTAREAASLSKPLELAKRLRAGLKRDQALVGYHLLPKHLLVLTLTQAKSGAVLIPLDTRAFSARVSGLHEALANPRATDVGARLLAVSSVLLRPVAKLLAGKKQLFVLPDGVLHTVPFDVLPGPEGRPLLESLAVTVLPSAETLLRAPRKGAPEARLFALADPVYPKLSAAAGADALDVAQAKTRGAKGIPALPETRTEVTAIGGLFKEKTILLGADARESTVKGRDLRAFSHVHFATHGVLAYELPNVTEPALILSRESGEDAFLTASEARRLKLNADVCVLSACNTGSGKVLNGEGVLGLSRAFLLAGSRAVLVSLWPVASEATKDLMIRFYKHVNAGKPKAEALRLAKLELARRGAKGGGTRGFGGIVQGKSTTPVDAKGDGRHPFFWAPFVLVGGE